MPPIAPSVSTRWIQSLADRLGAGAIVCDGAGRALEACSWIETRFPGALVAGEPLAAFFSRAGLRSSPCGRGGPSGDVYVRPGTDGDRYYRHVAVGTIASPDAPVERIEAGPEDATLWLEFLIDVTREKRLEASLVDYQQQLTSMQEITAALYESQSTKELIYLILVAVTSQMGFGFNRAFYLEAHDRVLRGKIGIGASSPEEAHRIWALLAELNLPDLRSVYDGLRTDGPPDPQTQEIAQKLEFRLDSTSSDFGRIVQSRRPEVLREGETLTSDELVLFQLLGTSEVAMVPLYARDHLAGVLIADNFVTREAIGEKALKLLETFSGYAGVALERSRLNEEINEKVEKLAAANETMRRDQRKLLQAEKLSALGQLAACVSHEIRNPLVAIGGLARKLLKDHAVAESGRESMSLIVDAVSRLEKFLRETLDYVKPEVIATQSVDIRDAVRSTVSTFRSQLDERSITVESDYGNEPIPCLIDPDVFRRAIENLVKNAMEALSHEGRIRIETSVDGRSAVIRIADSGPGIPREIRSRIFEPFFTTKSEGTGLGLAITAHGVRSLGGRISLQESTDWQTIFSISLPLGFAVQRPRAKKQKTKPRN